MSLRDDIKICYYNHKMNIGAEEIAKELGVKMDKNFWLTLVKAQGDIKRGVVVTHQAYRRQKQVPPE